MLNWVFYLIIFFSEILLVIFDSVLQALRYYCYLRPHRLTNEKPYCKASFVFWHSTSEDTLLELDHLRSLCYRCMWRRQHTSFPLLNSLYQLPGFSFGHDEIRTCCERMGKNDEQHCSHIYQKFQQDQEATKCSKSYKMRSEQTSSQSL